MKIRNCCNHNNKSKKCVRKSDNKIFSLPRRFSRKKCFKGIKGFTMRSSCAPYKDCRKISGGTKKKKKLYINGVCVLEPNKYKITGIIKLKETKKGLKVSYNINGLKDGLHGFHIHEFGDLTQGCISACSHFNPNNKNHGGLNSKERHLGDMGNIISKNGISKGKLFVKNINLTKNFKYSVLGRMIVVHDNKDDCGRGNNEESLKTGNAGSRLTCGIIGLSS